MPCDTQNHDRLRLKNLLREQSFRFGDFTLASGKKASYYVDCRMTTLSAEGSRLIGRLFYDLIVRFQVDSVGGMTLGADPMVSAITYRSMEVGHPLNGFLVRKVSKNHGTGRQIEGHLQPWMRVALVEDVVTTGGSTLKTIQAIRRTYPSVEIVGAFAIVDRQEGGAKAIAAQGIPFQSLYASSEFLPE